jgi:hypothetical protein
MPSIIVPTPSRLRPVMSWLSTQWPHAPTVCVATTLLSPASHARATPISGTPPYLWPGSRLVNASIRAWRPARLATCLQVRRPKRSLPLAWPVHARTALLFIMRRQPMVLVHRPHCRRPCLARARGCPRPAVPFTSRTAPPLAIGVSPLHLYVCARTSVECVCEMFYVCVVCTRP